MADSVWWPAHSPALDHEDFRIQPGTARAGEGAGHHTEPAFCHAGAVLSRSRVGHLWTYAVRMLPNTDWRGMEEFFN